MLKQYSLFLFGFFCALIVFGLSVNELPATMILDSSLSLSETYNDNIFFSSTDEKLDLVTTLSPNINFTFTSKSVTLGLGYHGAAQFYEKNSGEDGYFQNLSIDLDFPILNRQIKGVYVRVTEVMTFSPELPGFTFGGDASGEEELRRQNQTPEGIGQGVQLRRVDSFQNHAGISLSYDWTKRLNILTDYTNIVTRYEENTFPDRETHQTNLGGSYRYPISLRKGLNSSYKATLTTGEGKDQLIHGAKMDIDYKFTKVLSGAAGLGVSYLKGESFYLTALGSLSRYFRTGTFSLRYSSKVVSGLGVIQSVTRIQSLAATGNKTLGERVSSFLRGTYTENRSVSGIEVNVSTTVSMGLTFRLLEWLKGSINYGYLKQRARGHIGGDGERNTFSFALTAIGSSWRIFH